MEKNNSTRKGTAKSLVAAVIVCLLSSTMPASATEGEPFNGTFTAEPVRPPECTSPVGFCTHGVLVGENGKAAATYDFTMLTNEPTGNGTEHRFTGASVITKIAAPHGTMIGQDEGIIEFRAVGGSPFTTLVNVVGGTDAYDRAKGLITATGELDLLTGNTAGTYAGTISRAE